MDTGYIYEGQDLLRRSWDACPASLLRDSRLVSSVGLYRASQVSPLAGWPDKYAAWMELFLVEVDEAIQTQRKEVM